MGSGRGEENGKVIREWITGKVVRESNTVGNPGEIIQGKIKKTTVQRLEGELGSYLDSRNKTLSLDPITI
jgi:hypothetical protein